MIPAVLAAAAASAAGNMISSKFNQHLNLEMMDEQTENEKELQRSAYAFNNLAQQNQPSIMKHGLENAGLNPATATGAGAPSLQAGSAAGGNVGMSSLFSGVADLIAAAKAPTEIEKGEAEKSLAEAEAIRSKAEVSKLKYDTQNIQQDTQRLAQETQSAKNANDVFRAKNNFLKDSAGSIFEGYRSVLQSTGQWENLPWRTRDTIDSLADGDIQLDIGSLEAIDKIIDNQGKLSDRDKQIIHNLMDSIIAMRQMNNDKVMQSYETMPRAQKTLLIAEANNYFEQAAKAKTEADLNKLNKWITEHTSDEYLIEHGMKEEIERRKYKDFLNRLLNLPFNVIENTAPAAVMGGIMRGNKLLDMNNKQAPTEAKPKILVPSSTGNFSINGNTWR